MFDVDRLVMALDDLAGLAHVLRYPLALGLGLALRGVRHVRVGGTAKFLVDLLDGVRGRTRVGLPLGYSGQGHKRRCVCTN